MWALLERFHADHSYILEGADRAEVLRYEEEMYRETAPYANDFARVLAGQETDLLTQEQRNELGRRIDRLLDQRTSPTQQGLMAGLRRSRSLRMSMNFG
jgi:hypothetical protein